MGFSEDLRSNYFSYYYAIIEGFMLSSGFDYVFDSKFEEELILIGLILEA